MGRPGLALVELSVVEQRYRAVLAVQAGEPTIQVAAQLGLSRQTVQNRLRRYGEGGLAGLADQSRRPQGCPGQTASEVEAVICELRRAHPRWGARRIARELARAGASSAPSRITVHRVLARHGLVVPRSWTRQEFGDSTLDYFSRAYDGLHWLASVQGPRSIGLKRSSVSN